MYAKVPVKSSWNSKINWVQGISFIASIGGVFGLDLDTDTQVQLATGVTILQSFATWVLRTFFTDSVTRGSVRRD